MNRRLSPAPLGARPRDPRPSVGALLADPAVRTPLKSVLRNWAGRDPLDAAEDSGLLALALERIADEAYGRSVWGQAPIGDGGPDDREPA